MTGSETSQRALLDWDFGESTEFTRAWIAQLRGVAPEEVVLTGEPGFDDENPDEYPSPKPVRAKTFDEWLQSTSELLEECAARKR